MSVPTGNGPDSGSSWEEGFCRLLLDNIRDYAVIGLDPEGRITGWNIGAEALLGYTRDEIRGKDHSRFFTPEAIERGEPERELGEALETGQASVERWYVRKDGSRFWASYIVTALRDEAGRVLGFGKIVRDATERREAKEAQVERERTEEALRRSEAKFSGIISIAADAIVSVDEDQRIIVFNRGAEEIFGYRAEEVLGRPLDVLVPESVREIHREHVREFGRSGVQSRRMGQPGQVFGRRKNGELFPMDASISQVEVDGEKIYTAMARDVTDLVHTTEALRESNETLEAVVRASPLALKVLDADGRIEIWNPAAERIFGWKAEEVLGKELPTIPEDKREEAQRIHGAAFHGETITGFETSRVRKDGERIAVELSTAPLYDATGRVRGTMVVTEDITERKKSEEALQETTQRLQALVQAAPITVKLMDMEGRVQLWNPAAERIFGWTEEEVRGRVTPLIPEDKRDEFRGELEAAARGEAVVGLETERIRKDGSRAAVRISTAPIRAGTGEVTGMISLIEDVSEQKRVQEEQRRLSAILESTPDFVGTADPEGRILYLNRAARQMIGIAADQDVTELDLSSIHPKQALLRILSEAIPTAIREGSWSGESTLLCSDGREIPISQVVITHRDPDGNVEFLSTVVRDISELREREEALEFLAEAGEELAATLEYETALRDLARLAVPQIADYCLIDVVEDGEVRRMAAVHADPSKGEIMTRIARVVPSPERPIGVRQVIETGEPELVPEVTEAWIRATTDDEEHYQMIRELHPRSAMVVPLVARGNVLGTLSLAATERGRRYDEDDLVLAQELARRAALAIDNARLYQSSQEATRIRDEVLRIVAHDLRNPLHTVRLSVGLLLEMVGAERTDERRQLEIIERSIDRAERLIRDLLEVARAHAGALPIERGPVDPVELVRESVEAHREQAREKRLRLEAQVPPELPRIHADRGRIMQVLANLIGNAIKFTEEGGRVTVGAEEEDEFVRFRVTDTGPGIAREELPNLFNPFWQARRARRTGAGLGLAISKRIVEAHGGEIEVSSTVGVGTTFTFTIRVEGTVGGEVIEEAAD